MLETILAARHGSGTAARWRQAKPSTSCSGGGLAYSFSGESTDALPEQPVLEFEGSDGGTAGVPA
jgi:hypothetical protein